MEKDGKKRRSSSMSSMEENELAKKDLLIIGDIIRGKNNINSEDEKIKRREKRPLRGRKRRK